MGAFGPGDRVALRETPGDSGTELLLVNWDQHITGQIADVALVACEGNDFREQEPRA
jgi:hypothetical protein